MKKYLLSIITLFVGCSPSFASYGDLVQSQSILVHKVVDEVFTKTKVTILQNGGAGLFYDASAGKSDSVKVGYIDHILTNRFITADLGWYSGAERDTDGVIVGGPGVNVVGVLNYLFPDTSASVKGYLPEKAQKIGVGVNSGWGTDKSFHYGFHLAYNF